MVIGGIKRKAIIGQNVADVMSCRGTAWSKVVSWAGKKTGTAVRTEEDEEERGIVEVGRLRLC